MATRSVTRLALEEQLCRHLLANNVTTARDVLSLSALDLMELLGLTHSQAAQLLLAVSAQVTPPYTTAWDALEQLRSSQAACLLTGLPTLDGALRRGLPAGSITELVGPGGAGKSQLSHMMALRAALPAEMGGLAGGVVYIDTERKFSAPRLAEMTRTRLAAAAAAAAAGGADGVVGGGGGPQGAAATEAQVATVLGRVVILTVNSVAELTSAIERLEHLVLQHSARLVVVDSIAALARTEFGGGSLHGRDGAGSGGGGGGGVPHSGSIVERQEVLGRLAAHLKHVAESLRMPMLVTNQVTTRIGAAAAHAVPQRGGAQQAQRGGGGQLTAALGARWAHCVNVRLVLERVNERRFLRVAKSPSCANVALEFVIAPEGLVELPPEQQPDGGALLAQLQGRSGNVLEMAIRNEIDYYAGDEGLWQ